MLRGRGTVHATSLVRLDLLAKLDERKVTCNLFSRRKGKEMGTKRRTKLLHLQPELHEAIKARAERENRSVNNMIEEAIMRYLDSVRSQQAGRSWFNCSES